MAGLLARPPAAAPVGADPVAAELRRWAAEPFDLARDNCGLAVLAYAERATGRTLPRKGLTGTRTAAWAMKQPKNFAGIAIASMARLGCAATSEPERGDVGLVDLPGGLTACLCVDRGRWAARMERGVVIQPAEPRQAWRVIPRPSSEAAAREEASCPRR